MVVKVAVQQRVSQILVVAVVEMDILEVQAHLVVQVL